MPEHDNARLFRPYHHPDMVGQVPARLTTAAELIGVALLVHSQPNCVTCLDLSAWGATEG